ncbi:MAG: glycosyltransferase family 9 protein [Acidiferrobacterales bacterium]
MIAPAMREIFSQYPEAIFTLLTSRDGNQLYSNYSERMKEIWILPNSSIGRFISRIRFRFYLRKKTFDRTYCFDTDSRIQRLLGKSAKEVILSKTDPDGSAIKSALKTVGVNKPKLDSISLPALPIQQSCLRKMESTIGNNTEKHHPIVIGLHPTFSGLKRKKARLLKLWSFDNWASLANRLAKFGEDSDINIKLFIYTLPKDVKFGEIIKEKSTAEIHLLDPPANLEKYKAYLYSLDLFIAPDTGTAHLAACLGTKVIALFGYLPKPKDTLPTLTRIISKNSGKGINAINVGDVFEECKKAILQLTK